MEGVLAAFSYLTTEFWKLRIDYFAIFDYRAPRCPRACARLVRSTFEAAVVEFVEDGGGPIPPAICSS
jgi:hypothetical protein